jgi:sugar phosphate isomerase/epimerase
MLDWPAILGALRAAGYTGLIEIEHMPLVESAAGEQSLIDRLRDIDSQS